VVRTSLLAGVVGVHAFQGTRWTVAGEVPERAGAHHPSIAPYGLFHTATAPVQVACGSQGLWRALAGVVGLDAEDPRFATNVDRVTHREELVAALEEVFATGPAEHWLSLLGGAGVPAGKVRGLDEVYAWEQTLSQGLLLDVEHPRLGALQLPGSPLRFDDQPWSGGRRRHRPPPMLGEHDAAVRAELASAEEASPPR
jgi:crotonobetainyl-CoA:carnitine CoA-transferase CaiB-like acyl-CoA transferase